MDARVLAAAADNARWCDGVCRSHGLPTARSPGLWVAPEGSPRFYPDAVTLAPGLTADAVLGRIDARPGSSVKDSFADLDLGPHGYEVLFEARWLWRAPGACPAGPRLGWEAVTTPGDLAAWAGAAELEGILLPALLDDAPVRFLLARGGPSQMAGAVVHAADGVAGLSNVFAAGIDPDAVWADLPAVAALGAPDVPLVGYERGDALGSALAAGFEATGTLRVWMRPPTAPPAARDA